jgi:hypothetical protein
VRGPWHCRASRGCRAKARFRNCGSYRARVGTLGGQVRQRNDLNGTSSIESIALPSELRSTHDFAGTAKPILNLAMPRTPPPLRPEHHAEHAAEFTLQAIASAETDFHIKSQNDEHDPPFRTPAIWHAPPAPAQPSRHRLRSWQWSERSTAAFLGFAAGMLIIVPTVFFISLETNPRTARQPPAIEQPIKFAKADPNPVQRTVNLTPAAAAAETHIIATAHVVDGHWFDNSQQSNNQRPANAQSVLPVNEAEATATRLLADGHVTEARVALRAAASPDAPWLWFILAQTYDPFVANRGTQTQAGAATSANVTAADIKFADYYYHQALTHGVTAARPRIDALAKL